jgi:hypothetical protein
MAMRGRLFAIIPHAGWVNLQLADGPPPEPRRLIGGSRKKVRHIKVRSAWRRRPACQ